MSKLTLHSAQCKACQSLASQNKDVIKLLGEYRRDGLATILLAECLGCQKTFKLSTSSKVTLPGGLQRYVVNVKAVWDEMGCGGGASTLSERLGTMDIPSMQSRNFGHIGEQIGL